MFIRSKPHGKRRVNNHTHHELARCPARVPNTTKRQRMKLKLWGGACSHLSCALGWSLPSKSLESKKCVVLAFRVRGLTHSLISGVSAGRTSEGHSVSFRELRKRDSLYWRTVGKPNLVQTSSAFYIRWCRLFLTKTQRHDTQGNTGPLAAG